MDEFTNTQYCETNSLSRYDVVSTNPGAGQLAYDMIVILETSCAEENAILEYNSPYSLKHIILKAMTDDAQHATVGADVPTGVQVQNTRLLHAHPDLRLWDACAQQNLARLADQRVGTGAAPLLLSLEASSTAAQCHRLGRHVL